jgi:hypothetical protein
MTLLASQVHTLVDVASRQDPNGNAAAIAELLNQSNEILADMQWFEGNLTTGERTTVRTGLPSVAFRAINAGVPRSKSTVAQVDEGAAELVGESSVDRTLAILSKDPARYRLSEAAPFFEAMNETMTTTLFYGNAKANPKEFTGLAPRFNSLSGFNAKQIIDAGGTGTDNRSIWLIAWGENTVKGIYPQGTKAGLMHMDTTANRQAGPDGFPIGDYQTDANGNRYLSYSDHYQWNCGLAVKDYRYIIRIANIDKSDLTKNMATGADIQDLMVQALENIQSTSMPGMSVAFYAPRVVTSILRRQMVNNKSNFLSWEEIGGRKITAFQGIPIRRVDALETDEARVV